MQKIIVIGRMTAFMATLLSTIPLFVQYLAGSAPAHRFAVHVHVWFGLAFFVFTAAGVMQKRLAAAEK